MLPAAAILLVFLAYPLALGFWLGLTDTNAGRAGAGRRVANAAACCRGGFSNARADGCVCFHSVLIQGARRAGSRRRTPRG